MAQTEVALAVFLLMALSASLVSRKIKTPFTTLLVIFGLALAAIPITELGGITNFFNSLASGGLFVGLVLPPLLFEAIMSVRSSDFRAVYRPALLLATVGVLVSALVVGVVLWKVVGLDPLVAFVFAALISPTDVATVLEIFGRVNVPSRLATLIEMESVFNDATGIALLTVVLTTAAAAAWSRSGPSSPSRTPSAAEAETAPRNTTAAAGLGLRRFHTAATDATPPLASMWGQLRAPPLPWAVPILRL